MTVEFPGMNWEGIENASFRECLLGSPQDGVLFTLTNYPTCHRRGPWRLLAEVCPGPHHHLWGCFDDTDQPMRYYHHLASALGEAEALARVLWTDRYK